MYVCMYVKPIKDPLGVSPSKRNQGTTRGKEKILLTSMNRTQLRIRSTVTLSTELRGRTEIKVCDDLGGEPRPRESKGIYECCASCGSLIPFTRANAQWVFHGFHITY